LHDAVNKILEYDEDTDTLALPPDHAAIMDSDEGLMSIMCGLTENISYPYPLLKLAFITDGGIWWGGMRGVADMRKGSFKPFYEHLMPKWIEMSLSLSTVMSEPGTKVADLDCKKRWNSLSLTSLATILRVN
jgi:hypothetical protein